MPSFDKTELLNRFTPSIYSCSVPCFKQHKESSVCENKKPQPTQQPEGADPDPSPQSMIYVDPEDDEESVVPREALERLGEVREGAFT